MNFCSDNVTSAHPQIMQHLVEVNQQTSRMPYGEDPISLDVAQRFCDIFETTCGCYPVATGTAANALALSCSAPPYGAIFCHQESHIFMDECGAVEHASGGARLHPLPGPAGKIDPKAFQAVLAQNWRGVVHHVQPACLSISQPTEVGTTYTLEEIKTLANLCKDYGLLLHMDGARFANAIQNLGCRPAEMTWQVGIDLLSFGATKNGALAAECVLIFNPKLNTQTHVPFLRKRAGHLVSKMFLITAQLQAYLANDLWLDNASHANSMAQKLAQGLDKAGLKVLHPVEANEIFVTMDQPLVGALFDAGYQFYPWALGGPDCHRLVTAWSTKPQDVDNFLAAIAQYSHNQTAIRW